MFIYGIRTRLSRLLLYQYSFLLQNINKRLIQAPFTRYNLLPNVCIHDTTGCQKSVKPGLTCTTRFDNRLNEQWLFVQHGCQTGSQTNGLTTGCVV